MLGSDLVVRSRNADDAYDFVSLEKWQGDSPDTCLVDGVGNFTAREGRLLVYPAPSPLRNYLIGLRTSRSTACKSPLVIPTSHPKRRPTSAGVIILILSPEGGLLLHKLRAVCQPLEFCGNFICNLDTVAGVP